MDKKVKIKEIFLKLNPSGKDDVRKKISEKFNISVDTAKNHWIYNGNTPCWRECPARAENCVIGQPKGGL